MENQWSKVRQLQDTCEAADSIVLKLNWDMLREPHRYNQDFFYEEEDELVGFVGLYEFGNKVELCGMVHPEWRRKGIFTRLMQKALVEVEKKQYKTVLFNAPASSSSGKALLASMPCTYEMTEYQMRCLPSSNLKTLPTNEQISLRVANDQDRPFEITLDVTCFGYSEEEAQQMNQRIHKEVHQSFWIIENQNCPVGKVRLSKAEGDLWIYGLAVAPDKQGKGIGRATLSALINMHSKEPLFLDVEASNRHALKLYEACGFETFQAQDYYRWNGK
ncbi:GNAT family acetyltransferase [Fictibacillus macauensis ZFHKF-1]|uniref:GNAT family acetyltransferase n=1 Tax=Fictibacillus macauensis ZFHKF-1 TaxID=1196324 RepID=I8AM15_9BACL|nr:GNAT family N-acetyltransferase [Fictibacillus macauensis]EIT86967.1 GNAT family acetyltransferase [Fictibacillus macauensis ZFHKF-1]